MQRRLPKHTWIPLIFALLGAILAACASGLSEIDEPTPAAGQENIQEDALAATVNGQPITMQAFQQQLLREQEGLAALGREIANDGTLEKQALDLLIEYELIVQVATKQGLGATAGEIDSEVAIAVEASGSQEAFDAWLAANRWTQEEFRHQVQIDLLTEQLRQPILASVGNVGEQIHARHIVVDSEAEAQTVAQALSRGEDFSQLAADFSRDRTTRDKGGDLGWFPRGALLVKEVEDVAFALEPGQISAIVPSWLGYHIVQTLEQDPAREIPPETMNRLRQNALDEWRASLWEGAEIEVFVQLSS